MEKNSVKRSTKRCLRVLYRLCALVCALTVALAVPSVAIAEDEVMLTWDVSTWGDMESVYLAEVHEAHYWLIKISDDPLSYGQLLCSTMTMSIYDQAYNLVDEYSSPVNLAYVGYSDEFIGVYDSVDASKEDPATPYLVSVPADSEDFDRGLYVLFGSSASENLVVAVTKLVYPVSGESEEIDVGLDSVEELLDMEYIKMNERVEFGWKKCEYLVKLSDDVLDYAQLADANVVFGILYGSGLLYSESSSVASILVNNSDTSSLVDSGNMVLFTNYSQPSLISTDSYYVEGYPDITPGLWSVIYYSEEDGYYTGVISVSYGKEILAPEEQVQVSLDSIVAQMKQNNKSVSEIISDIEVLSGKLDGIQNNQQTIIGGLDEIQSDLNTGFGNVSDAINGSGADTSGMDSGLSNLGGQLGDLGAVEDQLGGAILDKVEVPDLILTQDQGAALALLVSCLNLAYVDLSGVQVLFAAVLFFGIIGVLLFGRRNL